MGASWTGRFVSGLYVDIQKRVAEMRLMMSTAPELCETDYHYHYQNILSLSNNISKAQ